MALIKKDWEAERNRRRLARWDQRAQIMGQRGQAAQTQYMDRMANRAEAGGASPGVVQAVRVGESLGANQDRQQKYLTAASQRQLNADTGRGLVLRGEGEKLSGQGDLLKGKAAVDSVGVDRERIGESARQFDKNYVLDNRKQDFVEESYVKPGIHTDDQGNAYTTGGAQPIHSPREISPGSGVYVGPKGDLATGPVRSAPEPVKVGNTLVDPTTGREIYQAPTSMEQFDDFTRKDFQRSPEFSKLKESGASNEEFEKAYRKWLNKTYPQD